MEAEKKIVFGLLATGAVALAVSSLLSYGINSSLAASAEENLPKILCATGGGGERLLSLPPSIGACTAFDELRNNPFSEGSCDLLPAGKRGACRGLYALAAERAGDCADFLLLNQTKFAQAAPQAAQLCAALEN